MMSLAEIGRYPCKNTLMILRFMTAVIGEQANKIEMLINRLYIYSSYGRPNLKFHSMKWGESVITDAWNGELQV